jgi:hypothetical protein
VVSNPHIKRVYNAYFHAFETLRVYPLVKSVADNAAFCTLLRRLVDEHGELLCTSLHSALHRVLCSAVCLEYTGKCDALWIVSCVGGDAASARCLQASLVCRPLIACNSTWLLLLLLLL